MAPKAAKPTSDELLAQFDNLDVKQSDKQSDRPKPAAAPDNAKVDEDDPLAELGRLATQRPSSGPGTPRLSSDRARPSTRSPRPSATLDRPSEEKTSARQSEEIGRTSRSAVKQEQPKSELEITEQQDAQGGGWWGGLFATASAAMKQAEAAVKEIQNNEEAQRWAQQVKGNVGALKDFGTFVSVSCLYTTKLTSLAQAASFATWLFRHLPTSSTHLPLPFRPTNASKSM